MVDYYPADKVNETAHGAVTAAGGVVRVTRYPAGSLLIKENFNARKKLAGVTAMFKLPHYDGADRNWVMAAYSDQGKPLAFGKARSCIQCHMVAQKQDFLFAPPPINLPPAAFFPDQKISPAYLRLLQEHPGSALGRNPGPAMEVFLNPSAFLA
ncbi:cytochrome P460 family protein [Acidithiobacillus sp.]|uniref:cytochrome P460 family protein n=1 Tax=Acidithiobacillus sp. TaxID=1872118 RepID=UPI003CFE87BD